jgi:hypothetical protein
MSALAYGVFGVLYAAIGSLYFHDGEHFVGWIWVAGALLWWLSAGLQWWNERR